MLKLTAASRSYGNTSQYIARITGRDSRYTYAREFTGRKDKDSTTAYVDEPGLYETVDIDKKGRKDETLWAVIHRPEGMPPLSAGADVDFMGFPVTEREAMELAKRLGDGENMDAILEPTASEDGKTYGYRIRKPGEAKRATAAASVAAAVTACWEVLQAFPPKEAKAIIKALKERVTPKQAEPEPVQPEAPAMEAE